MLKLDKKIEEIKKELSYLEDKKNTIDLLKSLRRFLKDPTLVTTLLTEEGYKKSFKSSSIDYKVSNKLIKTINEILEKLEDEYYESRHQSISATAPKHINVGAGVSTSKQLNHYISHSSSLSPSMKYDSGKVG